MRSCDPFDPTERKGSSMSPSTRRSPSVPLSCGRHAVHPLTLLCVLTAVWPIVQKVAEATFSATSLPTLIAMVAEGMGATLLPDLAITSGMAGGNGIAIRPISGEANTRGIGLAWRRQSGRVQTFMDIGDFLRSWAKAEIRPWRGNGEVKS